jgi:hypothetical protein
MGTRKERVETVAAVKERQMMWVQWMKDATERLEDSDLVVTVSDINVFGTYLMDIRKP